MHLSDVYSIYTIPVSIESFERMKSISKDKKGKIKYKHLLGNFYIWFDWKASKVQNKIFIIKLQKIKKMEMQL